MASKYQAKAPEKQYTPAYVVEKLDGTYTKQIAVKDDKGIHFESKELPRGYLVIFPGNQHSVHYDTYEKLEEAGFADTTVPLLDAEGDVAGVAPNMGVLEKRNKSNA